MKKNLDGAYAYMGKTYGPGEAELLDKILENEDLSAAFREAIEGKPKEEGPAPVGSLLTVDAGLAAEMSAAGYATVEDVNSASDKDILGDVASLNKDRLKAIREEAKS